MTSRRWILLRPQEILSICSKSNLISCIILDCSTVSVKIQSVMVEFEKWKNLVETRNTVIVFSFMGIYCVMWMAAYKDLLVQMLQ
jgi:hypothetical protein